jgi:hypothetical protein
MPITLDGTLGITTPALTVTGATVNTGGISTAGNLTFTSTGQRITGDFSNATVANRLIFQTSTTNGNTNIQGMPNGTSNTTWFKAYNGTDPDNSGMSEFGITASETRLTSNKTGTGTYLPLTIYTGGSERMRISTAGGVSIGATTEAGATNLLVAGSVNAGGGSVLGKLTAYGSTLGSIVLQNSSSSAYWITVNSASGNFLSIGGNGGTAPSSGAINIDSGGAVGINTSSPNFTLQVNATNEWPIAMRSASNTTTYRGTYQSQKALGTLTSPLVVTANTILGGIECGGYNGTAYTLGYNGGSAIMTYAESTWTGSSNPTYMAFYTNATGVAGYSERMRITAAGNVGIGTGNPGSKLVVAGGNVTLTQTGGDVYLTIQETSATNYAQALILQDSATSWYVVNKYGGSPVGASGFGIGTTNIGEMLQIDTSGNVYLGTAGTSIYNSSGRKILNQTGSVLQIVMGSTTTLVSTASGSPVDSGLSATITPSSTSSRILVLTSCRIFAQPGTPASVTLVRTSTVIQGMSRYGLTDSSGAGNGEQFVTSIVDSPATASAVTYKVQMARQSGSGVIYAQLDSDFSSMTLVEIAG